MAVKQNNLLAVIIGKKIKELRLLLGFSSYEFCRKLNICEQNLPNYEEGKIKAPEEVLVKILYILMQNKKFKNANINIFYDEYVKLELERFETRGLYE